VDWRLDIHAIAEVISIGVWKEKKRVVCAIPSLGKEEVGVKSGVQVALQLGARINPSLPLRSNLAAPPFGRKLKSRPAPMELSNADTGFIGGASIFKNTRYN
jgi:hypothetical protein